MQLLLILPVFRRPTAGNSQRRAVGVVPLVQHTVHDYPSERTTQRLNEEGYEAVTLAGGMDRWSGYRNGTIGYKLGALLRRVI